MSKDPWKNPVMIPYRRNEGGGRLLELVERAKPYVRAMQIDPRIRDCHVWERMHRSPHVGEFLRSCQVELVEILFGFDYEKFRALDRDPCFDGSPWGYELEEEDGEGTKKVSRVLGKCLMTASAGEYEELVSVDNDFSGDRKYRKTGRVFVVCQNLQAGELEFHTAEVPEEVLEFVDMLMDADSEGRWDYVSQRGIPLFPNSVINAVKLENDSAKAEVANEAAKAAIGGIEYILVDLEQDVLRGEFPHEHTGTKTALEHLGGVEQKMLEDTYGIRDGNVLVSSKFVPGEVLGYFCRIDRVRKERDRLLSLDVEECNEDESVRLARHYVNKKQYERAIQYADRAISFVDQDSDIEGQNGSGFFEKARALSEIEGVDPEKVGWECWQAERRGYSSREEGASNSTYFMREKHDQW